MKNNGFTLAMTNAVDCGGGRLRARKTGYGVSPSFLLQALYAREPRAAAKGNASGPRGAVDAGGDIRQGALRAHL